MKIIYRFSLGGYPKTKLYGAVTNAVCINNFCSVWGIDDTNKSKFGDTFVMALDGPPPGIEFIRNLVGGAKTIFDTAVPIQAGSSGASFREAVKYALTNFSDDDIVYLVENDYIHLPGARDVLLEGIQHADYVTLYCHPDKFLPASMGGNPEVDDSGSTVTRVFRTKSAFWALVNSTTMTFATTVKTLREDSDIIFKHCANAYPTDYQMFLELRDKGRTLIQPMPTYATHTELA
jgi:hypothetical protein